MVDLAGAVLSGGARFLQVRAKAGASGWLLDVATAIVARARAAGAMVVVNDRADIARLSGADGVHLGQDDLDAASARALLGEAAVIGLSTHTMAQVDAALAVPVTYLAMGPVFGTGTKDTGYAAVGLEMVRAAAERARAERRPVVAIGGITPQTAPALIEAGAASVAVISDLLATGDPDARVRAYLDRLSRVADV
jgi:thiamine-phosphate pyrophosphorylase